MANDNQIGKVNFGEECHKIKFMFDIKIKITNIINITFNKFILGLYDSEKNESLIREFIINEAEDGEINFECIGEGRFEQITIENIIIINESKILARTTNGKYIIIQKYSKLKEIFEYKKILKEEEKEINNEKQNDEQIKEAVNDKQKEININNKIKQEKKENNLKEEEKNIKEDKDKIIIKEEKEIKPEKKEINNKKNKNENKNKDKTEDKKNEEDSKNNDKIMILNENKKQHNK